MVIIFLSIIISISSLFITYKNKENIVQAKKDALKIFDDILNKEKLDKQDLENIIDCIYIYEDKIIIKLKYHYRKCEINLNCLDKISLTDIKILV